MRSLILSATFAVAVAVALAAKSTASTNIVRVIGDRVNLRAGPGDETEVVWQASGGDTLVVLDNEADDWLQVLVPSNASLWVYGELVKDGLVAVPKLLIRSGPGISYRPVGSVTGGMALTIRGQSGGWIEIAPPTTCGLWVNSKYVEKATPEANDVAAEEGISLDARASENELAAGQPPLAETTNSNMSPPPRIAPSRIEEESSNATTDAVNLRTVVPVEDETPSKPDANPAQLAARHPQIEQTPVKAVQSEPAGVFAARQPSSELLERGLVASVSQGKTAQYEGTLGKSYMVLLSPSKYSLLKRDSKGRTITLCYVLGDESRLASLVGRRILVQGREYWLQGARDPLVVFDTLRPTD